MGLGLVIVRGACYEFRVESCEFRVTGLRLLLAFNLGLIAVCSPLLSEVCSFKLPISFDVITNYAERG